MNASEIRRQFLDYFAERGHRVVPSAPVFPQDDPTLLFTNAGMNQFKDVFLGTGRRDWSRAADTQKCIRVSGKHNDLEEVGVDTYHHTFFEMLGNWSFGDYFKEEAITWAWELLVDVWKLPKDRLWVTVFSGDEGDGLPADDEAERIWREKTDIDPSHVLRFDRKDNFWEMGETGPCGPCSEIHIDRGGADANPTDGADREIGVNAGNERFIEIWNLVFIQFNRQDDRSLQPLPAKHVDTGMGFERLVSVLQGKSSNYDTDVFSPIFARIGELAGRAYGAGDGAADVAFRVIADHVRAVTSALADGALPSNVGRGYVLRRLIRRASRYGRQALGREEPFLFDVAPAVAENLGETFPEIAQRLEHVRTVIRAEEEAFGKTLGRGLVRFAELAERVEKAAGKVIPGKAAYELYATYGFPQDLVELMARERGMEVDQDGWEAAAQAHQLASRSDEKFTDTVPAETLAGHAPTRSPHLSLDVHFLDVPESLEVETVIQTVYLHPDGTATLTGADSSFYPEGGGQVGDIGTIGAGDFHLEVECVQKRGEVVLHRGRLDGEPRKGQQAEFKVNEEHRRRVRGNHTATHLVHRALREVLGDHVVQQGSYVGPDRLRFDFANPRALTSDEIERVETLVNHHVRANHTVTRSTEDLEAAQARGVIALFGEKYAEKVRVVEVGDWSAELCGGTHVQQTGEIGLFVITSESAIQAGVRRIEAMTGAAALEWIQERRRLLGGAARALKSSPEELAGRIEQLQARIREARKKATKDAAADVESAFARVRDDLQEREGVGFTFSCLDLPLDALRDLATRVKGLRADLAAVLVGLDGKKVPWIALCQGAALDRGLDAREVARLLREKLGGGGGGRPELAQGQGKDPAGREAAAAAYEESPEAVFGG